MSLPVRIISVGSHTPGMRVTSEQLDRRFGRSAGTTAARSGVRERRWIGTGETSVTMAVAALGQALQRAELAVDDLDALIAAARWIGGRIGKPNPSALSRAGGWPRGAG